MVLTIKKFKKSSLKKFVRKPSTISTRRYPARLKGSRTNYAINKAVSKAVNGMSENKLSPCKSYDEELPAPIQAGAIAYTKSFAIGALPTQWAAIVGASPLGGMSFAPGTGHQQRIGRFIYLQKTHLSIEIDTQYAKSDARPTEFRVILLKARRSNNPMGISNSYDNSLFLNPGGDTFGHATPGINGSDLMMQPLNRKDWDIRKDTKFMLSHPALINSTFVAQTSSKYASFKRMTFNLPYYAKTECLNNVPSDLDTSYVVVVYARSLSKDAPAGQWEMTTRGTTTYKDN